VPVRPDPHGRRWAAAGAWVRIHDALRAHARVRAGRRPMPTGADRGGDRLRLCPGRRHRAGALARL